MYKQYARPLARVVHGFPSSWEPVFATVYVDELRPAAAWSACNKFIAVAKPKSVEIRDAATLNLLYTFRSPATPEPPRLHFSPDSRFLTQFNRGGLVTWDLRTGSSVSTTFPSKLRVDSSDFSSTYSMDGKMLAVVCLDESKNIFIATHDLSTTHSHLHRVSGGRIITPIWTHGEFLRFATVEPGHITIWEVEFASTRTPEAIDSLPTPGDISGAKAFERSLFLPGLSRLAIAFIDGLVVWDARDSKDLLYIPKWNYAGMSFSSDGSFFTCAIRSIGEVRVWKESPAGYVLHQKLAFSTLHMSTGPLLSPNGGSIAISFYSIIHLWHTKHQILPKDPTPTPELQLRPFILGFSPGETLAAYVRVGQKIAKVIRLPQGDSLLEIDTDMKVECLGVTGSTIIVVDRKKVATWNLVAGNARASTRDVIQVTPFDLSPPSRFVRQFTSERVSPDFSWIITSGVATDSRTHGLELYDVSTGRCLAGAPYTIGSALKSPFTPDGFKVTDI